MQDQRMHSLFKTQILEKHSKIYGYYIIPLDELQS